MAVPAKISVLVSDDEAHRFDAYCNERGYKKSTLIVRLIKEYLDREQYPIQGALLGQDTVKNRSSVVTRNNG